LSSALASEVQRPGERSIDLTGIAIGQAQLQHAYPENRIK